MSRLADNEAQRRADEIKARRSEQADSPDSEPVFDTRPRHLVSVAVPPCGAETGEWTCVSRPHPDSPDKHYYAKKA